MKQPARLGLFLTLIGTGLLLGFLYWNQPRAGLARHYKLATWGLGHFLAQKSPNSKVLVVSNPFMQQATLSKASREQEAYRVEGLKAGFGAQAGSLTVSYPALKPGALENPRNFILDPATSTPVSYLVTSNAFDLLVAQSPGADVVVSLVGLPANLAALASWNKSGTPQYAFLFPDFRFLGGVPAIREAMHRGKLVAFVLLKPGAASEPEAVRQLDQTEFDRHFLLVHDDNLDQVLEQWPESLGSGR